VYAAPRRAVACGPMRGDGDICGMSTSNPLSLSICIVAHNEEENIGRTLASVVGWAPEVIVLDCGSSDRTGEIAREAGAIVEWAPNAAPEVSKNKCFEMATQEWIFSLDADEIIPDDLKRNIEEVIASDPAENGFKLPRRNFYFGTPLMHGGNYPDTQTRLFRRGRGRFPVGVDTMHSRMTIDGALGALKHPFDHHPYPTFQQWLKKFDFYTDYGASVLAARNVPITRKSIRHHMIRRPLRRYFERLVLKRGIRDGVPGVLAATFDLVTNVVSFGKYWQSRQAPAGETRPAHGRETE
jgi:glycosyltransferase involved in cell wall biosynthesis